jgi:hypothetical protein
MLDALCGPRKVRLLLFPDLNQLSETFISELDERFKKTWDEDQKEAAKVVGENLSLISAYLAKNLEIPATLGFGGDILSVEQIEDITVSSVRTPFPLEREDGKPFILTAELEVSLRAIVRGPSIPWFLSQPPTVRVGSAVLNPYLPPLKQTTNEPTEQIIKRTVQVEIRATEKDGQYSNLEPVSVSLK